MPERCKACWHSATVELDRAIVAGWSYRAIGRAFGMTAMAVRHHAIAHLGPPATQNRELAITKGAPSGELPAMPDTTARDFGFALRRIRRERETIPGGRAHG